MVWILWLVVLAAALTVGLVASPLGTVMGAVALAAFVRSNISYAAALRRRRTAEGGRTP